MINTSRDDSPYVGILEAEEPDEDQGILDWLDLPGQGKYGQRGGIVTGANLTFKFISGLLDTVDGAGCSTTWTLHLTGADGNLQMTN